MVSVPTEDLRSENTDYFFKILIGWMFNNKFFCGVTNAENTFTVTLLYTDFKNSCAIYVCGTFDTYFFWIL